MFANNKSGLGPTMVNIQNKNLKANDYIGYVLKLSEKRHLLDILEIIDSFPTSAEFCHLLT